MGLDTMGTPNMPTNDADTSGIETVRRQIDETLTEWRSDSDIYWDQNRSAWVVIGYDLATSVLHNDKQFWRDTPDRPGAEAFWGRRHLTMLNLSEGDHRRLHSAHMRLTGESFANEMRIPVARAIATRLSKEIVTQGQADITDYANQVVTLVGCQNLGIDIEDANLVEQISTGMDQRAPWKEAFHTGPGIPIDSPIAKAGLAGIQSVSAALLPIIRDRKRNPQNDLISAFWVEGAKLFDDWDERDMVSACWSNIDNETKPLLRGLVYILCRDADIQKRLRSDDDLVELFVEEGLRYLSPFRCMRRVARRDTVLGGKEVKRGEFLYLIIPMVHRDETAWACPHSFDLSRDQEKPHFAFGFGAGYCVGRYVGRVMAQEAIRGLLGSCSRMEIDPSATQMPKWSGEMAHSVSPIPTVFSPL
jgi:cytochrome P450